MGPRPPTPHDRAGLRRVRSALLAAQYDARRLHEVLPDEVLDTYLDAWNAPVLEQTKNQTQLNTLARLFVLGLSVTASDLASVRGAELEDWINAGLVRRRGEQVVPLVAVQAIELEANKIFLASDLSDPAGQPSADLATPVSSSSTLLVRLAPRHEVERALDVGAGTGAQAIVAAQHSRRVVATDVNPRALEFCRFNAALNGVSNIDLRLGDLFETVRGEHFDLIVSNPPNAVSPATEYLYRDSPIPVDGVSETVVSGAARHLAEGGWALINCDWARRETERWQPRLRTWVTGAGCYMLVLELQEQDPVTYAVGWLKDLGKVDPQAADAEFRKWMAFYEGHGIHSIHSGVVVLRKT